MFGPQHHTSNTIHISWQFQISKSVGLKVCQSLLGVPNLIHFQYLVSWWFQPLEKMGEYVWQICFFFPKNFGVKIETCLKTTLGYPISQSPGRACWYPQGSVSKGAGQKRETHGGVTLPKTNIAPENRPLEKEIPIGNHPFSGAMLVSGRVFFLGCRGSGKQWPKP